MQITLAVRLDIDPAIWSRTYGTPPDPISITTDVTTYVATALAGQPGFTDDGTLGDTSRVAFVTPQNVWADDIPCPQG